MIQRLYKTNQKSNFVISFSILEIFTKKWKKIDFCFCFWCRTDWMERYTHCLWSVYSTVLHCRRSNYMESWSFFFKFLDEVGQKEITMWNFRNLALKLVSPWLNMGGRQILNRLCSFSFIFWSFYYFPLASTWNLLLWKGLSFWNVWFGKVNIGLILTEGVEFFQKYSGGS